MEFVLFCMFASFLHPLHLLFLKQQLTQLLLSYPLMKPFRSNCVVRFRCVDRKLCKRWAEFWRSSAQHLLSKSPFRGICRAVFKQE
jgi:hypothetical protein